MTRDERIAELGRHGIAVDQTRHGGIAGSVVLTATQLDKLVRLLRRKDREIDRLVRNLTQGSRF